MAWIRMTGTKSLPKGWIDGSNLFPSLINSLPTSPQTYNADLRKVKFMRIVCDYYYDNPSKFYGNLTKGISGNVQFNSSTWKTFVFDDNGLRLTALGDTSRLVVRKVYISYDDVRPTPEPTE